MELSRNDWKLFRERLPGWQERYMDKLTREYAEFLTNDNCRPSERFWALNKRIREDRRKPGIQLEIRKQNVVFDLAHLIADGAVSLDELDAKPYTMHRLTGHRRCFCMQTAFSLCADMGQPCGVA